MKSPLRLLGEISFRNPKKGVRRLTVGHRQRLEVEPFRFRSLSQQLPVVPAVINRRDGATSHRVIESFGSYQTAECLARQNQAGAQLEHLSRSECRRQIGKHGAWRIIDRLSRPGVVRDHLAKREHLALRTRPRTQPLIRVKNRQGLHYVVRSIVCSVAAIGARRSLQGQSIAVE